MFNEQFFADLSSYQNTQITGFGKLMYMSNQSVMFDERERLEALSGKLLDVRRCVLCPVIFYHK